MISCVPNVSEGRDQPLLDVIADAIRSVPLLDRSSDRDHNRSVFTFAGEPEAVLAASLELAAAVFSHLSLADHSGAHPRIGVLDVLPFVPVSAATMESCIALARRAAEAIWKHWRVPSFLYAAAGSRPLEEVRRIAAAGAKPDIGTGRHETAGAVAIGARPFLIAWNIWLATEDLAIAKSIANRIRAASGGFTGVKALGLPLVSRKLVQVSINTTDFEAAPLVVVFRAVDLLAREAGVAVIGCERIGLFPRQACAPELPWLNWDDDPVLEQRYSRSSAGNSRA